MHNKLKDVQQWKGSSSTKGEKKGRDNWYRNNVYETQESPIPKICKGNKKPDTTNE